MIRLDIFTPEWSRTVENAEAVFLPGTVCPFEVLKDHAAMISSLSGGEIRWRVSGCEESLTIKGGMARIKDNVIKVCAEV